MAHIYVSEAVDVMASWDEMGAGNQVCLTGRLTAERFHLLTTGSYIVIDYRKAHSGFAIQFSCCCDAANACD